MRRDQEIMICAGAVDRYGATNQILKAVEALGELSSAIARYLQSEDVTEVDTANLTEEIADVEIMLLQLRLIFDDGEIDLRREEELNRLSAALNDWRCCALRDRARRMAKQDAACADACAVADGEGRVDRA